MHLCVCFFRVRIVLTKSLAVPPAKPTGKESRGLFLVRLITVQTRLQEAIRATTDVLRTCCLQEK